MILGAKSILPFTSSTKNVIALGSSAAVLGLSIFAHSAVDIVERTGQPEHFRLVNVYEVDHSSVPMIDCPMARSRFGYLMSTPEGREQLGREMKGMLETETPFAYTDECITFDAGAPKLWKDKEEIDSNINLGDLSPMNQSDIKIDELTPLYDTYISLIKPTALPEMYNTGTLYKETYPTQNCYVNYKKKFKKGVTPGRLPKWYLELPTI